MDPFAWHVVVGREARESAPEARRGARPPLIRARIGTTGAIFYRGPQRPRRRPALPVASLKVALLQLRALRARWSQIGSCSGHACGFRRWGSACTAGSTAGGQRGHGQQRVEALALQSSSECSTSASLHLAAVDAASSMASARNMSRAVSVRCLAACVRDHA